jgi:hypothetical protein
LRQRGAVHALRAEHIDVVELGQLFRREGFRRPEHHVARVVDHHVQATVRGDDLFDRSGGGGLGGDIELDGAEIGAVVSGIRLRLGNHSMPR